VIVVVGCGVSGLTSAVALLERGYRVEIRARRRPPHTTSNVAAAFWYPYRAYPQDLVTRWGAVSLRRFLALTEEPDAGITVRQAFDFSREPMPRPWWGATMSSLRELTAAERPEGFSHGWTFEAPVIDMRAYLPWLMHRFESGGGVIREQHVHNLREFEADAIVNCTGLGARQLCGDDSLVPIRGQLVHVANPGLSDVLLDEHEAAGISYIVPRGDDCVLGGTAQEGDESLAARPEESRGILERCSRLAPALRGAIVTADVVGLRPGRHAVRLEVEHVPTMPPLVHNYGHGGAGVTLSWGCAIDVAEHVDNLMRPASATSIP
jgi:D-amino-acid oxidase